MTRRGWLALVVLTSGMTGCAPDGPREFYRGALAARSELVDSLSQVVDEASAKRVKDYAFKLHDERLKEIEDDLAKSRTRVDPAYRKLRRDNFKPEMIEAEDRAAMIVGMRSYAAYCKNVVYTNARLTRELDRIWMLIKLEMAAKARAQLLANQAVSVNAETDAPNLSSIVKQFDKKLDNRMSFIPPATTKEHVKLLNAGIDDEELKLIFDFDLGDLNAPAPGLTPPPLPSFPDWAIEVDRRAPSVGLAQKRTRFVPKQAEGQ